MVWKKYIERYFLIILSLGFLFGFFLPLSTKISNAVLIALLLGVAGLSFIGKMKLNHAALKILKYSTLVLLLPCFLSIFYKEEFLTVLNILGRRVSYLLLPLSFLFFSPSQLLSLKKYSLIGIVYGAVLSCLILLYNNFLNYYATRPLLIDDELLNFYYTGFNFTELLDFHPSYFGMYILLAISVLLFEPYSIYKYFKIFIFFILSVSILFVNSRVILFLYLLLVVVYLFKFSILFFKNTIIALFSFLSLCAIILFSIYYITKSTYIYRSFTSEALWELTFNVGEKYNSTTVGDSRLARWSVALESISQRPILGYGVGKEKDVLKKGYIKEGMLSSAKKRYDTHNQFLGYVMDAGIVGLATILYYFIFSFFLFYKSQNFMFIILLLQILAICLFENYLNNNAGIIYVAFYSNLFLFIAFLTKPEKRKWVFGR